VYVRLCAYFTLQQVKVSIEIVFGSQLTRKDDKNRQFVLLIIDISKHGAKEM
jgi:hypothetical protein